MTSAMQPVPRMTVPLLDLRRDGEELDRELVDAFQRVLRSGHYILGPEVEAFEAECAKYIGCKHAIGVSSGTDALLVSLMALGVGQGDEVVCPTFTFFATVGTIWRLGAKPVFVDSSLEDFNIKPEQIAAAITPKTRAIVPVHLFGRMCDMAKVREAAGSVPIVEDAAQALGSHCSEGAAGTAGSMACFSFFPSKNLGGLGDSGLVSTNDGQLADAVRLLRSHGGRPKYFHHVVGGNFRIDALQAALLRPKLRRLDAWSQKRRSNADTYTKLFAASGCAEPNTGQLDASVPLLYPRPVEGHIYNQYCVRIVGPGRRDGLRKHLERCGIGTEIYYPVPMHRQACFAGLQYAAGAFPNAERAAAESLALPIFPQLKAAEIQYVVDEVVRFLGRQV